MRYIIHNHLEVLCMLWGAFGSILALCAPRSTQRASRALLPAVKPFGLLLPVLLIRSTLFDTAKCSRCNHRSYTISSALAQNMLVPYNPLTANTHSPLTGCSPGSSAMKTRRLTVFLQVRLYVRGRGKLYDNNIYIKHLLLVIDYITCADYLKSIFYQ